MLLNQSNQTYSDKKKKTSANWKENRNGIVDMLNHRDPSRLVRNYQQQPNVQSRQVPPAPNVSPGVVSPNPSASSFPCKFSNSSRSDSRIYPVDVVGDFPFRNRRIKFHDHEKVKIRHRPHRGDVAIGPGGRLINPYNIFPYVYYVKTPHRRHHGHH